MHKQGQISVTSCAMSVGRNLSVCAGSPRCLSLSDLVIVLRLLCLLKRRVGT